MSPKIIDEKRKDSPSYVGQDILLPPKNWYIFLSLTIALLLNLLPLQGIILLLRPDFVALAILYWGINQPQRIGMSLAFCLGLLMDISNASLLGQHALAYCVIVYFAFIFHRRLRIFSLMQQAPQIGLVLFAMQTILLLIELLSGAYFPGWSFFLASVTGALFWAPISFLLGMPLRPRPGPDEL